MRDISADNVRVALKNVSSGGFFIYGHVQKYYRKLWCLDNGGIKTHQNITKEVKS